MHRHCRRLVRAVSLAVVVLASGFSLAAVATGQPAGISSGKVSCGYTHFTRSIGVYVWKTGAVACATARRVMHRSVKHSRETRGWNCYPGRYYYICDDRRGAARAYAVLDPLPGMGD